MQIAEKKISSDNAFAKRATVALFIHSLSIISFQIVLMRILSINQWDHFANMIIGIAMLGFGVSGSLLAITKEKLLKHARTLIPLLMVLSSVFILTAYRLSQHQIFRFDTFLVFSSVSQMLRLLLFISLYFLPFFTASLAIGMLYVTNVESIGKLYFSNLIGSGLGGIAGLLILHIFMPHTALVITAFFPAIAALLLIDKVKTKALIAAFFVFVFLSAFSLIKPLPPFLSQYKSLAKTLQLPSAHKAGISKGASSLVHIVETPYLRYAPGLSLHYRATVPSKALAFVNGNAAGFIPEYSKTDTTDILDYSTFYLPYLLKKPVNTAIVAGGTGGMAAQALRKDARSVYVFEHDKTLINALEEYHREKSTGVYADERVVLQTTEARTYFYRTEMTFDMIILPAIGSFGGNSGLDAMRENYSFTIEALQLYWQRLSDDGILSVTVYKDYPPRASLKTLASLVKMLSEEGVKIPQEHIAAVRSWTAITFVVSKKTIDENKSVLIRDFCDKMGFDPFLLPDISEEERKFYNLTEDNTLFDVSDAIISGNKSELVDNYLFYINPAQDNKPFFSRFIRLSGFKELLNHYHYSEIPFLELGYVIVWLTFLISFILSTFFILLPVFSIGNSRAGIPVLLYFGGIGLGFMFAEIILIQKFVLYLGQPVYAVSAVLSIMLIFSGLGSYYSSSLPPGGKRHQLAFAIIFILLISYSLFLTPFLRHTAGSNLIVKSVVILVVAGLPAFFMGLPFPLGLRRLAVEHKDKIAWGWGINGFLSVIATPMALIIAVEAGSLPVIVLAATAYLVSLAALTMLGSLRLTK